MKFYRENKVNPFASCLPMVAQFPVFISLYYMLRIDLRYDICPDINPVSSNNPQPCGSTDASQFLFIHDLTDKATGATLVDPDRALRRLAAALDAADVDDDGQDAADDLPGAAVHLRHCSSSSSRPACSSTGSPRTCGRSCSRRSSRSASGRCARRRRGGEAARVVRRSASATATSAATDDDDKAPREEASQGEGRRRGAQGPAVRAAAGTAAQEEETFRETAMSDPRDRVKDLLEHVSDALALQADGDRRGGGPEHPRPPSRATTSGCSSAATGRRSTPFSTWRSRPRRAITRRPRACAWSSTPPATASGASRRCSARPTRRPTNAVRSAARSRWTR